MRRLYVLYDADCGLCSRIRRWAEAHTTYIDLEFVAAQSARARQWFPTLVRPDRHPEELVVVSDEGGVYREDTSWIMVLYATHKYRPWALRLARPGLLPYSRRAFRALTGNRQTLSDVFGLVSDADLAAYLRAHERTLVRAGGTAVSRHAERASTTAKSEQTRRRILESALVLFGERGFEETTMRDVAKHAGLATTGAAYYYFASKEELILEFYRESASAVGERARALASGPDGGDLTSRLAGILALRFEHFAPYRASLGALFRSGADPASPISPFGERTADLREEAIELFRAALESSKTRPPKDLEPYLPRLLWLYQMGLLLFWIYDRSEGQARTHALTAKSLDLVVGLIRLSKFPLLRPLRRSVIEILAAIEA